MDRFVAALEKATANDDGEEINASLDAVCVAHMATSLKSNSGSSESWHDEAQHAINEVVAAWEAYQTTGEYTDELNKALDALAIAHAAKTFEWATGPLKW